MKSKSYTVPLIISLLQFKSKVSEASYYGADLTASTMLLDLDIIIGRAKLTAKQTFIMERHWVQGYTQEEVAQGLHITQQMCQKTCKAIKKKIHKVLVEMGEIPNDAQ